MTAEYIEFASGVTQAGSVTSYAPSAAPARLTHFAGASACTPAPAFSMPS